MLSFSLNTGRSGIRLEGDYTSLKALHEVINDVNERSPLIKDQEGLFIALAYDVRKAYTQQRDIIQPPEHFEEIGTRYGVGIIWPVLLLQHQMLRSSLAFIEHGPQHQACAYMLETIIEEALKADFGAEADHIRDAWKGMSGNVSFFEDRYSARCALYCSWDPDERQAGLTELLMSMSPMFGRLQGRSKLVTPAAIASWEDREWPNPD